MKSSLSEPGYKMTFRAERQERKCPNAAFGMDWQGKSGEPREGGSLPCAGAWIWLRGRKHREHGHPWGQSCGLEVPAAGVRGQGEVYLHRYIHAENDTI